MKLSALLTTAFIIAATGTVARAQQATPHRVFATPEEAVSALLATVKGDDLNALLAIFGPEGKDLIDSSDPATARMNRQVFAVAAKEHQELVDDGPNRKTLVIGNEAWPFPVPLVKGADGWRFDTAAGKEEVVARRIGRNELAAIDTCRAYVTAQGRYAEESHDGKPAGTFATAFNSDPGKQNGLYWPTGRGQKRSPLGDLVAQAAEDGRPLTGAQARPAPFRGYYFKILSQPAGFALVAWPAEYDVTGVMTFIVAKDGIVRQKDLGPDTDAAARQMTAYATDKTWTPVE